MNPDETPSRSRWPLILVLSVVGTVALVLNTPLLSVRHIEIDGANRSSAGDRVAASGVGEGALLLWVDTGAIERAVRSDPWVSDVRVSRVWPDRIVVEVRERRPIVWVEGVLGWMQVAEDGTVVARADEAGQGLLRARVAFPDRDPGDRPVDPAWHEIVEMALVLADDLGPTMTLEMRGSEMWTHALGHDVRLGYPIGLGDKARSLVALVGETIPAGATIDLTSPRRPAVVVEGNPAP